LRQLRFLEDFMPMTRLNAVDSLPPRVLRSFSWPLAVALTLLAAGLIGCGNSAGAAADENDSLASSLKGDAAGDGVSGTIPSVQILSPKDGKVFLVDRTVEIFVKVSDVHADANDLRVVLTDSASAGEPLYNGMGKNGNSPMAYLLMTAGAHKLTAVVTNAAGRMATASVTIYGKTAPGAPVVAILPDPATTLDALTAQIIHDSKDPDGKPGDLTYTYTWFRNGQPTPQTAVTVPPGVAKKMELWKVVVLPHSGGLDGVAGEALLTVADAAPSTPTVAIVPDVVDLASTVSCTLAAAATDVDGDALSYAYFWIVDGYLNPAPTTAIVALGELHANASGGPVKIGSTLVCRAIASDCQQSGLPADSSPVTVSGFDVCASALNPCSSHATCTNTDSLVALCACNPGWTGSGDVCVDMNECVQGAGGCSGYAICTNTEGSFFCTCKEGFTGDGKTCTAIDACATNNGGCDAHATCTNTASGPTCACNPGWTGSGDVCVDMNECVQGAGGCSGYAICTNTEGSFFCTCKEGFTGDGKTCNDVNECAGKFGTFYTPDWSAGLDGWTTVNSAMPVGWQILDGQLIYGNPDSGDYSSDGANNGTATSPHIQVPAGAAPQLTFLLTNDTETKSPLTNDLLTVSILHGGVETVVLTKADLPVSAVATGYSVTLDAALAGQAIQVRFSFDTVDGKYNGKSGITIADLAIAGTLNNCDAHASCANTTGSFTCACTLPYTGDGVTCSTF
jgi:hypothetical protein